MPINASKTANSNINLELWHQNLKQQVTTHPHVRPKFKWIDFEANATRNGCHPDIFKSDTLKEPKLPFRLSLRATSSLATAKRQSLLVLCLWVFSIVRLLNLTLRGKWQIWVTKVKKKNVFYHPKKWGGGAPPSPTPCTVPERIRANGTTLLRIIFFPRRLQSVMRYWMCSSFIHAWNLNNTSVHVSLRVIKCSFQNYGIPGHVIWILNLNK